MQLYDRAYSACAVLGLASPLSVALLQQCKDGYDLLDVKGKTIVDVGADWGMSPLYFWIRGAKRIIAYEEDPGRRAGIRRLAEKGLPITIMKGWHGEPTPKADVLKMDIEGGEKYLGHCEALDGFEQWAIAIHDGTFWLKEFLSKKGGRKVFGQPGEEVWLNSGFRQQKI